MVALMVGLGVVVLGVAAGVGLGRLVLAGWFALVRGGRQV